MKKYMTDNEMRNEVDFYAEAVKGGGYDADVALLRYWRDMRSEHNYSGGVVDDSPNPIALMS